MVTPVCLRYTGLQLHPQYIPYALALLARPHPRVLLVQLLQFCCLVAPVLCVGDGPLLVPEDGRLLLLLVPLCCRAVGLAARPAPSSLGAVCHQVLLGLAPVTPLHRLCCGGGRGLHQDLHGVLF